MEKNTKAKRSTFAILFYLNTSKRRKDGTCPIVGRITVDANSVQFSTKINLSSPDWDAKKGRAKNTLTPGAGLDMAGSTLRAIGSVSKQQSTVL